MGEDFIGYCDDCQAPIAQKSAWVLVRDTLAYDLLTVLPAWVMMETRLGKWLLGFAGRHAFTCTCPGKCREPNFSKRSE